MTPGPDFLVWWAFQAVGSAGGWLSGGENRFFRYLANLVMSAMLFHLMSEI